jgi:predicted glycosyltransferase
MGTGTPEGLRIAIYSQDSFGLGHMRRICCFAWEIYCLRTEASILTFSGSQLSQFFPISPHHNYIKLPSTAKDSPGNQRQPVASGNGWPVIP